jgi:hypothetical protein
MCRLRWDGFDWIDLAQDRDQCRVLVNTVMNLRVAWNAAKFLSSCTISGFSRRAQLHEWASEFSSRAAELLSSTGSSSGDGSRRWLRRKGRKWIRLCKEDFMRNLKLQWDSYKSVARIQLVKTENPRERERECERESEWVSEWVCVCVCSTVNWKCVE